MGPDDLLGHTCGHALHKIEEKREHDQTKQDVAAFEDQMGDGGSFAADIRHGSGQERRHGCSDICAQDDRYGVFQPDQILLGQNRENTDRNRRSMNDRRNDHPQAYPVQRVLGHREILNKGRRLLELHCLLTDHVQPEEDQAEIENHFTRRFPVVPAGQPQKPSDRDEKRRKLRKSPDDKLDRQRRTDIRPQNDGERAVETDQTGADESDRERRRGRRTLKDNSG